jgi:hypothetical protein
MNDYKAKIEDYVFRITEYANSVETPGMKEEWEQELLQLITEARIEELEDITNFFARPFEADPEIEKLLKALDARIAKLKEGIGQNE